AETDAVEAVKKITGGAGADVSLEASGSAEVLRQAVDCLAPTGTCGIVGAPAFGTEVSLDVNTILTAGRAVRGIVEGDSIPDIFIPRLIALWQQGRFPIERLITHYDFDRIDEAAHDAEQGKVVKPVLRIGS
ncbi:MAG: zinc-binding dehydrogenase, partial [Actinomycetota bacterium]|nr:zinc-binding dehydrogenase [Actinomycetota bacterium]